MMKNLIVLLFSTTLFWGTCKSQDWPQYLGPERNATLQDAKISNVWPESGPEKLWEISLGKGYGGASVHSDEVFVLDRVEAKQDVLRCIDLESGKQKWELAYDAPGELPYPGSRAVPTVDSEHVWMVGPLGHFHCIDRKTQQVVWKTNIVDDFEVEMALWGIAQSPIIYNDLVIVAPAGEKSGVVAYNKLTGEIKWQSRKLTGRAFYVSPTLGNYGGTDQVIVISPYDKKDTTNLIKQEIVAFEASNGKELWSYDGLKTFANIAPVTIIDETKLFITDCSYNDNYKPVSTLLKIIKTDNQFKVSELFLTDRAGCKMHPAVYYKDYLYLNNNGKKGQMACLNMKGENVWKNNDEVPKFDLGAYILLGDLIINQNGKNGDIHLIEPSPQGYKELAKASFFSGKKSQAWAPLAFSNGKLLFRDMEKMVCVDLGTP